MWGFGWLTKSNRSVPDTPPPSDQLSCHSTPDSPDSTLLLEDLPPKFQDNVEEKQKIETLIKKQSPNILEKAVSSISTDDFKNVHQIPCFRQGMLAGMGIGGVIFAVLISTRSTVSRSMNWGMGGFIIGSIASWEQCRSKMRQSKRNAQAVRESLRKPRETE